ncbi:MAG: tetratricopeptide repeat protein [Chloroflexota bacterium]
MSKSLQIFLVMLFGILWIILVAITGWLPYIISFTIVGIILLVLSIRHFDYVRHPKAFIQNELGGVQLLRGKVDAALPHFEKAIKLNPDSAWAYHNRAFVYFGKEKYAEALDDYNRAISIKPDFTKAYAWRGAVYVKQKRLEDALADTDKASQLKPRNLWAAIIRAAAFTESKKYEEAIIAYQTAIRLRPRFVLTFIELGICCSRKGDFAQAEAAYSHALKLPSKKLIKALIYNNRGYMFVMKGEYEKAFADLDQATRLNPKLHSVASSRAEAYFLLGKYEEALTEFTKSAELKPNNKFAIAGQAISQYKLGNLDEAKGLWQQLIEQDSRYKQVETLEDDFHCTPALLDGARKVVALIN